MPTMPPPVNPLGDLFKTQVWALARHVGVPEDIVRKPATADLIEGQTDEGDFGISYSKADLILFYLLQGLRGEEIASRGFTEPEIAIVRKRPREHPLEATLAHGCDGEPDGDREYYLRPVDY